MTGTDKQGEIRKVARDLYSRSPQWVDFYREVLGPRGVVRLFYPTLDALAKFEQTEAYEEIQGMLTKLREQDAGDIDTNEPTRVITVRLPKSLHEALRDEAYEHRTSMNKLCISKLLQFIDNQRVPSES